MTHSHPPSHLESLCACEDLVACLCDRDVLCEDIRGVVTVYFLSCIFVCNS